jgi:hypothetical protein
VRRYPVAVGLLLSLLRRCQLRAIRAGSKWVFRRFLPRTRARLGRRLDLGSANDLQLLPGRGKVQKLTGGWPSKNVSPLPGCGSQKPCPLPRGLEGQARVAAPTSGAATDAATEGHRRHLPARGPPHQTGAVQPAKCPLDLGGGSTYADSGLPRVNRSLFFGSLPWGTTGVRPRLIRPCRVRPARGPPSLADTNCVTLFRPTARHKSTHPQERPQLKRGPR